MRTLRYFIYRNSVSFLQPFALNRPHSGFKLKTSALQSFSREAREGTGRILSSFFAPSRASSALGKETTDFMFWETVPCV